MLEVFEKWLRTACFQKPTPEAYDLAKDAWQEAVKQEREAIVAAIEEIDEPPYHGYENPNTFDEGVTAAMDVVRSRTVPVPAKE